VVTEQEIRVVLVDDHLTARRGVEMLLRADDIAVVGVADGARAALPLMVRRRPDVALVDIALAEGDGIDLCRQIAEQASQTGVLLYTGSPDPRVLSTALAAGPAGIALKAGRPQELIDAIRVVARGGTYFDPRLKAMLAAREVRAPVLSPREREVLSFLADGLTGEQIAERLVLSPETIRTHVRNAMGKLGAKTRVHALALALEGGEVELHDS
jgi:DNA-binding NarL/FixJ family response regulator